MVRLPAEWEEHESVLLTWPHEESDWAPIMADVERTYYAIVDALVTSVNVIIATHPSKLSTLQTQLQKYLKHTPYCVSLYPVETNDTWARDHGPISVVDMSMMDMSLVDTSVVGKTGMTLMDFTFNGWGNKFAAEKDNQVTKTLHQQGAFKSAAIQSHTLILEGGAIESDGHGCLLTTRACLGNPNRNPHISEGELEEQLKQYLGVQKILWLDHGYLAGDDTDSHIDTLARFAPNNTITYVHCDDTSDEHFDALQRMEAQLQTLRNCEGDAFTLIPLPWPSAKYNAEGERLPATYANYLITNDQVLVPIYNDANDALALAQIAKAHPNHKVVGINCLSLIEQHGSLHCITMQIPKSAEAQEQTNC